MQNIPYINGPDNPLISIIIFNYQPEKLKQCFDEIFSQKVLNNIEIIFVDNNSADGSWEIALRYAQKYNGRITLKQTKKNDAENNNFYALCLATGKYYITLTNNKTLSPTHIRNCIIAMEANNQAEFTTVKRRNIFTPPLSICKNQPLVSVLIINFNYGRYLQQCLDSIIFQNYKNFEIIISDNASTDNSWEIIVEYSRKYPETISPIRNRKNFGPNKNLENCLTSIKGKYFVVLCSDDAMDPNFLSKCVTALEAYPNAGFAMTHRSIIDENGSLLNEPPFYNQSCVIPGTEQAAVFMMAAVNPCISQIMYSHEKSQPLLTTKESLLSRWFSQRILDFKLCCEFDMIYLKDPLLMNRVHSASDSYAISNNLIEIFSQYILPHQFAEIAKNKKGMDKAIERVPKALEKLSSLSLRYCTNALKNKDEKTALRYFKLSFVIMPEITNDPIYTILHEYWKADSTQKSRLIQRLETTRDLTSRNTSYDPPPRSITLEI